MIKLALAAVAALSLTACTQADGSTAAGMVGSPMWQMTASREAKLATYQQECAGYGFQPGTEAMANCVMQVAQGTSARAAAQMQSVSNQMNQMSQPRPMGITNCNAIGNTLNCHSF